MVSSQTASGPPSSRPSPTVITRPVSPSAGGASRRGSRRTAFPLTPAISPHFPSSAAPSPGGELQLARDERRPPAHDAVGAERDHRAGDEHVDQRRRVQHRLAGVHDVVERAADPRGERNLLRGIGRRPPHPAEDVERETEPDGRAERGDVEPRVRAVGSGRASRRRTVPIATLASSGQSCRSSAVDADVEVPEERADGELRRWAGGIDAAGRRATRRRSPARRPS